MVKIAISGCVHGELEVMYDTVRHIEEQEGVKVDLLLCCGDFQSVRNAADLLCMAVPPKFRQMNTFYKYYSGELKAPVLTVFVGGNHEASNYLQELPYGGWVAPNIYFMGTSGCVNFRGIRIAGISGIFKQHDYSRPHYECVPYANDSMRSVYHTRAIDVFRLSLLANSPYDEQATQDVQLEKHATFRPDGDDKCESTAAAADSQQKSEKKTYRKRVDIVLSHDWPTNIYRHGDWNELLRRKPFFRDEVMSGILGSPPLENLLHKLKPRYWFAAHLHCAFAALVDHDRAENSTPETGSAISTKSNRVTRFLALDKALPRRHFLQILDIDPEDGELDAEVSSKSELDEPDAKVRKLEDGSEMKDAGADVAEPSSNKSKLQLDKVFLAVLRKTDSLTRGTFSDADADPARFAPNISEVKAIEADFDHRFEVPDNFEITAPSSVQQRDAHMVASQIIVNPQTTLLCTMLDIRHPNADRSQSGAGNYRQPDQGQVDFDAVGRFAERSGGMFSQEKVANPDEIQLSDSDSDVHDHDQGQQPEEGTESQQQGDDS